MPFAPRIRKNILAALNGYVIPALRSHTILQWCAEEPFDFLQLPHWKERQEPLPDHLHAPSQRLRRWKDESIISTNFPAFGFVYKGASYERIGITQSAAAKMRKDGVFVPAGITIIKLSAPGIICYPPYSLRSAGARPNIQWYKDAKEEVEVLAFHLINDEVRVFISVRSFDRWEEDDGAYPLQVNDPLLAQLGNIYLDELRQSNNQQNAQSLLYVFMHRLRRYMQHNRPMISNSCWVDPSAEIFTSQNVSADYKELCDAVKDYVQVHLRECLSLQSIADAFAISPAHLNRIFHQVHEITVMRYVTALRIKIAKRILMDTPERISDVAELAGFSSVASFSTVFQRIEQCSPSEYRQKHAST